MCSSLLATPRSRGLVFRSQLLIDNDWLSIQEPRLGPETGRSGTSDSSEGSCQKMSEQTVIFIQILLATIIVFAVFTEMVAAMVFHALNCPLSDQTISFLKWLVKVLVGLLFTFISVPSLRWIGSFLK